MSTSRNVKVALCQISTTSDKVANIKTACDAIEEAAAANSDIIALPECFNSPYDTASFPVYAEKIPASAEQLTEAEHPSTFALSQAAKRFSRHIIGGSIPERGDDDRVYNTCVVFGPDGGILGKHRKMHLFDINVPGKITFRESDTLSAGNSVTVIDTPLCKLGVGICYDLRFPELSMLMRAAGCDALFFPGAFNLTTGPAHWELLLRARALDNQCYVCAVSPARGPPGGGYQAWGHSTAVSPWGEVIATTGHESAIVYAVLELGRNAEVRASIPVSQQKRRDVYGLQGPGERAGL
ncbi:putative carbon-nitrogen hydrolase [Tribonema minus]|uniref:Putative carbon-nitrogen hydrolase n=1 Tax=Tribonema minus TaxID=303371 RepID=A0A835ZEK3_9STRA|nr:putative carbon-nitrogen hydrolase [Tribonema minus]